MSSSLRKEVASLRSEALAYLENHSVMTLATTGKLELWAAALFYVNDGFILYFLSAPTTRHCQNIAVHPGVAATIQEQYEDWPTIKGIQLEGQAMQISGAERARAITRYGLKFPIVRRLDQAPAEIVKAMSKIAWYKVVPDRLYYIDNSCGLGYRGEITL
jgi:uncharacterized protein YhbP (UPF0306 family)